MTNTGSYAFRFPPEDRVPLRVRRGLEALRSDLDDEDLESLRLLATELTTNALRHSRARERGESLVVNVSIERELVLLQVYDPGPGFDPNAPEADPLSEGGRGLLLVDSLARRWGVRRVSRHGKAWSCVWAQLPRSSEHP